MSIEGYNTRFSIRNLNLILGKNEKFWAEIGQIILKCIKIHNIFPKGFLVLGEGYIFLISSSSFKVVSQKMSVSWVNMSIFPTGIHPTVHFGIYDTNYIGMK